MSTKETYGPDVYGEAMHTAMRKLMDSEASAYAWNVVHLLDESWSGFCEEAAKAQAKDGPALKAVFEANAWTPDRERRTRESFYAVQIFRMALDDFDEGDWQALAGYLEEGA